VSGLFSCQQFSGFGPTTLDPLTPAPAIHQAQAKTIPTLRKRVREVCPRRPGVYGMVDPNGELIYVGKAKLLRARLLSYFSGGSRDPKAGRILEQTRTIVWEYAPSEFAALLRELELIRRWRPRLNVQGQPHRRRRTYICLGRRPAPYAFLTRRPPAGFLACFGPIPAGRKAQEAVRRLNDWFQLRDCPQAQKMHFADQGELFPMVRAAGCLRYEIGTCLGPCAGACTWPAYQEKICRARAFLAGKDPAPLAQLEADMMAAAAALAYERAAALRDKLEVFRWLRHQLDVLQTARERHTFVYAVSGLAERNLWYLIRQGHAETVLPAPTDTPSRQAMAAVLEKIYPTPPALVPPGPVEDVETVLLVAGWFRRHPEERTQTLGAAEALALCQATPVGPLTLPKVIHQYPGNQVRQQHRHARHAHRLAREFPQQQRHQEQLNAQENA
jgi:excinuclease ABC subunit C